MDLLTPPAASRRLLLLLLLAAAAASPWLACAPPLDAPEFADQTDAGTLDAGDDDTGTDDADAAASLSDLSGTWALAMDWSTCVTVFSRTELRNRYLSLVTIAQTGRRLTETHTVCDVTNTPLIGLETVVPTSVVAASSPFTVSSAVIGTPGNLGYIGGVQAHLWGLRMDDPVADPFPDANDDPRIYDSDQDGHPGATLKIGGDLCEVRVAQRLLASVTGPLSPDGRAITAAGFNVTEQHRIDSTNSFCAVSYQTESNDLHSAVRMLRVDAQGLNLSPSGDPITCDTLRANLDRIITWLPPDDTRCALDAPP